MYYNVECEYSLFLFHKDNIFRIMYYFKIDAINFIKIKISRYLLYAL
jgi:hypothetical protein